MPDYRSNDPEAERTHSQTFDHGGRGAVTEPILSTRARADAEALLKRADAAAEEEKQREEREQEVIAEGIRAFADGVTQLARRLDALEQSRDARRKLDAASEATREMLELPKDAPELDLTDDTPSPSGELHALEAKDPAEHQPANDQGGLPAELTSKVPVDPGNYPTLEDPQPPQVSQPIALEE
jgi:hypothetical protein